MVFSKGRTYLYGGDSALKLGYDSENRFSVPFPHSVFYKPQKLFTANWDIAKKNCYDNQNLVLCWILFCK